MVSDQEIAQCVETILRQSDPNAVTSLSGVVQQLESKLGLDLSQKASFIRDQINLLLRSQPRPFPHFAPQFHPNFHNSHPQFLPHFALHHHQHPPQHHQPQHQQHHLPQNINLNFLQPHHYQQPPLPQQQQQRPETNNLNILQPQQQLQPQVQAPLVFKGEVDVEDTKPPAQTQLRQAQAPLVFKDEADVEDTKPQLQPALVFKAEADVHGTKPQVQASLVFKAEADVLQDAQANVSDSLKESAPAKRRGGPGGLNKVCGVTPELQVIVGEPQLPRTEIVKQLWAYIRKNNLQDPSNKRKIICDDALRVVFETDCTDMFKMNKLLSKHIIRLEPTKESVRAKKLRVEVESPTENTEPGPPPVILSEALANFFGTGERELLQSEVFRRIWEYIKINNLEDPLNSMVILCDAKLQQLLGCESISALGIPEMLARHHLFRR